MAKKIEYTRVSQRKYAEMLGLSNTAVSKAIQAKKIVQGFDENTNEILVELANKEWGDLVNRRSLSDMVPANEGEATKLKKGELLSYNEARRYRENCAAKLAAMDVEERVGTMVKKSEVTSVLFAFGQQVRTNILSIPDRVIDNILAAKSRAQAHSILYSALQGSLEDLTSEKDFDFQPR
jgi:hypothetical protein